LQKADAKCFSTKAFKNMTRLRLLQLVGVQLHGDFEYLSRNLRWLSWNGFPLTCIPTSFYLGNLVSIELVNSNVEFLWKKAQVLIFISCSIFGFVVISNFDPIVRPYRIDPVQVCIILRPYIYTEMYPFFKYFAKVIPNECIKENDTKIQ
jgi:hypothetical protein